MTRDQFNEDQLQLIKSVIDTAADDATAAILVAGIVRMGQLGRACAEVMKASIAEQGGLPGTPLEDFDEGVDQLFYGLGFA